MSEGYKTTVIGEIPSSWKISSLREVAVILPSNVDKKIQPGERKVRLCNYMDVYKNNYISGNLKLSEGSATDTEIEKFLLKQGDVIITKDSETKEDIAQSAAVVQGFEDVVCGYHLALIRPDLSKIDGIYLAKLFELNAIRKQLINRANGTTRFGLSVGIINDLIIPVPDLGEQQKIAEILSTVDDKIEIIEEQISQTTELKKGLMQQLLTRGIGHTQFKASPLGEIPNTWDLQRIGSVCKVCVGKDLIDNNFSAFGTKEHKFPVYSNTVENQGLYGYYNIEEYTGNSVTVIGRGVGVGTAFARTGSFGAIGRLIVLFPHDLLDYQYLSYTINFCVKFFTESSAIPQLTGAQIAKYFIPVPGLNEQKKIASILISVDEKLDTLQQKKKQYQSFKKGLMQQLLTGKLRVDHLIPEHVTTQPANLRAAAEC